MSPTICLVMDKCIQLWLQLGYIEIKMSIFIVMLSDLGFSLYFSSIGTADKRSTQLCSLQVGQQITSFTTLILTTKVKPNSSLDIVTSPEGAWSENWSEERERETCHCVYGKLLGGGSAPGRFLWCLKWLWLVSGEIVASASEAVSSMQLLKPWSLYPGCASPLKLPRQRCATCTGFSAQPYNYRHVLWLISEVWSLVHGLQSPLDFLHVLSFLS